MISFLYYKIRFYIPLQLKYVHSLHHYLLFDLLILLIYLCQDIYNYLIKIEY